MSRTEEDVQIPDKMNAVVCYAPGKAQDDLK